MSTRLVGIVGTLLLVAAPLCGFAAKKAAAPVEKPAPRPASIGGVPTIYREPYVGMIAIDGATGRTLCEDNPDAVVYPASIVKLMTLFVIEDCIQRGSVHLNDSITVNAEMSRMGASQVYLKENEVFTVEDLIYALMVKSANDAAAALAIHVAGTQQAFVELMNQKAHALGLAHTHFYSCHGLPPTPPRTSQEVDVSTPRDLAVLGRALVDAHPEVLQYTSTMKRTFRPGPHGIDMINHDHRLMSTTPGMDGLKTGYFEAAGYSSVVTVKRNDRRIFVVVAGSGHMDFGKARDKAAAEAIARAFAALPPAPVAPAVARPATNAASGAAAAGTEPRDPTAAPPLSDPPKHAGHSNARVMAIVVGALAVGVGATLGFMAWRRRADDGMTVGSDARPPLRPPTMLRR